MLLPLYDSVHHSGNVSKFMLELYLSDSMTQVATDIWLLGCSRTTTEESDLRAIRTSSESDGRRSFSYINCDIPVSVVNDLYLKS